jgi:hypothetical protein
VGLERDPLSLVNTTEELIGEKSSGSGLKNKNTAEGIRHAELALTSRISDGRSVGIFRSRTQATELFKIKLSISSLALIFQSSVSLVVQ